MDDEALRIKQLKFLTMKRCHLREAPSLRYAAASLRELNLNDNFITSLPMDYFQGCVRLHSVFLGNNYLTSLPEISCVHTTLKSIFFHGNMISGISAIYKVNFPKLRKIIVCENAIAYFNFTAISTKWPVLETLDLSRNNMTWMDDVRREEMDTECMLLLKNNPWHCGEKMVWLLNASVEETCVQRHCRIALGDFEVWNDNSFICESPEYLKGMSILKLGNQ